MDALRFMLRCGSCERSGPSGGSRCRSRLPLGAYVKILDPFAGRRHFDRSALTRSGELGVRGGRYAPSLSRWSHCQPEPRLASRARLAVLRGAGGRRRPPPGIAQRIALESANAARNALAFLAEQLIYTNPLAVPLWLMGILAPFQILGCAICGSSRSPTRSFSRSPYCRARKGYYIVGSMHRFSQSAGLPSSASRGRCGRRFAALVVTGVAALPLSLPVLSPSGLIAYAQAVGLTGRGGTVPHLVQPVFAEEFGGNAGARRRNRLFRVATATERRAAVYADTYGDAAALDFYGPRYDLPPAISSQNSYYLWGTRGYDGRVLIAVGATQVERLRRYYRSVTLVRTSNEPLKWVVEGPAPIYVCRDPVAPLSEIWPRLRWYGA